MVKLILTFIDLILIFYLRDTCGPQAILRSLGGDILDMKKSQQEKAVPLNYLDEATCNEGGIIAYRDIQELNLLLEDLDSK